MAVKMLQVREERSIKMIKVEESEKERHASALLLIHAV